MEYRRSYIRFKRNGKKADETFCFNLGAGACKEVNLSIGTELKLEIEHLLKIQFQHSFQQENSDYQIT